jgi:Uma2 family endonuclease
MKLPDDAHAELLDGVLVVMSPAGGDHGSVTVRLLSALAVWVHERELGEVFDSSTGFILGRDPDILRAPDAAFVAAARLPARRRGFLEVAPDLAVEILSPSNTVVEMSRKLRDYFRAGVRLVWVIDPQTRSVAVHAADGPIQAWLEEGATLDGGEVLPGFAVPLARIFAGLSRDEDAAPAAGA